MPQIVGIAGGSCAGKTWLATRLQNSLGKVAGRLSLDDFYRDRSHLPKGIRERINFDHPRAIDWDRLQEVLTKLKSGQAASIPQYDFSTHGRKAIDTVLAPAPIMIFEGLWLFRRAAIRKLFSYRIFIESPLDLCEQRRIDRDVAERGRTAEFARLQFRRDTLPMQERYVAPQARWADVVLSKPPTDQTVQEITRNIQQLLKRSEPSHERSGN